MPVEAVLTVIALAVLANLVLMGVALLGVRGSDEDERPGRPLRPIPIEPEAAADLSTGARPAPPEAVAGRPGPAGHPGPVHPAATMADLRRRLLDPAGPAVAPEAFDRVVRVVAWIFLLATTTIVAVTGLWTETQPAILVLLALAGFFVLVVHDLLPSDALGEAKFVVEGSAAITFAALLVLLTGQAASPFFFTFPLIVGGAALVVTARATIGLTSAAAVAYLVAIAVGRADPFPPATVAIVGVNITALLLLAYVAMVIATEQRHAREEAVRLSTVDPLTGLYNRAYFFAALEREISRSQRTGRRFCLLMMDLDELKTVNDRFGHFHGDRVLRAIGDVIHGSVRRIDVAARYGGDEFVALLPETDPTGAWVLAEKIRLGAGELTFDVDGSEIRTTVSVGVVSHPDDGERADDLMIAADAAMYASKRAGKDRVMGPPGRTPRDTSGPGGRGPRGVPNGGRGTRAGDAPQAGGTDGDGPRAVQEGRGPRAV